MRRGRASIGAAALLALTLLPGAAGADRQTTQRRIRGVITAVDAATVTITPVRGRHATVTGRLDAARTHVVVDGHAARASELEVTQRAVAELSLDDVWMTIRVLE